MLRCPSCLADIFKDYNEISGHFIDMEEKSDAEHIMWLNRYISKERISALELSSRIEDYFRTDSLKKWIIDRMIKIFFSEKPHPFIVAMQKPSKYTLDHGIPVFMVGYLITILFAVFNQACHFIS